MKPTRKQLLDLVVGEDVAMLLETAPAILLAKVSMEGVWNVGVRVKGWEKEGGLVFALPPSASAKRTHVGALSNPSQTVHNFGEVETKLRIVLALTFSYKQVEFCSLPGEVTLLGQAADLPELTTASGLCRLSIGESFELLGEKTPYNLAKWYKPLEVTEGRNVALGEGLCKVWATDGQLALVTWAGGRRGGLCELANVVVETNKAPKAQLEAKLTQLEKAYSEALELIQRLTKKD